MHVWITYHSITSSFLHLSIPTRCLIRHFFSSSNEKSTKWFLILVSSCPLQNETWKKEYRCMQNVSYLFIIRDINKIMSIPSGILNVGIVTDREGENIKLNDIQSESMIHNFCIIIVFLISLFILFFSCAVTPFSQVMECLATSNMFHPATL